MRQNGRVLDDFAFRDSPGMDAELDKFIPLPIFKGWKVKFDIWPHDILLRADKGGAGIPAA
jgi:hypothetical protein